MTKRELAEKESYKLYPVSIQKRKIFMLGFDFYEKSEKCDNCNGTGSTDKDGFDKCCCCRGSGKII